MEGKRLVSQEELDRGRLDEDDPETRASLENYQLAQHKVVRRLEPSPEEIAEADAQNKEFCEEVKQEQHSKQRCCDHCRHPGCLGLLPYDEDSEQISVHMPGLTVANSKQQGGKSHLLKYLAYKNRHRLRYGVAFGNSAFNKGNLDWIPDKYKYHFWDDEVVQKLMAEQQRTGKKYLAWIIVDDDMSGFNSKVMKRVATQLFQWNIWMWISTQDVNALQSGVREQATNVAIFETSTYNSMKASYLNYGLDYYKQKDFEDVIRTNTGNHQFIWKDVKGGKPWKAYICPPVIPHFMLNLPDDGSGQGDDLGGDGSGDGEPTPSEAQEREGTLSGRKRGHEGPGPADRGEVGEGEDGPDEKRLRGLSGQEPPQRKSKGSQVRGNGQGLFGGGLLRKR